MFNPKQLKYISDQDFLLTKHQIMEQMAALLEKVRNELATDLKRDERFLPKGCDITQGKISKGENYKGLPYMVLDFPRYFSKEDIFLLRTMFWWGNEFSVMFILKGEPFELLKPQLSQFLESDVSKDFYLTIGDSPWEYLFTKDNQVLVNELSTDQKSKVLQKGFIKLAKPFPLDQFIELSSFVKALWKTLSEKIDH